MSSPSPQLPLGQVIGSRYRVQSLVGRGGMGLVYAATHELTGRRVALKLMLSDGDGDDSPVLHERFLSEARIAAAVRHPNIVDVLDMGLHDGAPFIVMELLEGVSLEHVLQTQQRLSVQQTLSWLFPIIGALGVLHDAGIVHRDVKPSNIFMSSLPRHPMRPKLLDFGLARVVSDLRLTRSGTVIGTPLYMAPEHAAGLVTGPQADVWSIGVVLYEALAGISPFKFTDRTSLAMQVLAGLVQPIAGVRPDLPDAICGVIGRALQRDLTRRFPDMRSLAFALHSAARASQVPLPTDPDPIGLPDYVRWQAGELPGVTTQEHQMPGAGSGAHLPPGQPTQVRFDSHAQSVRSGLSETVSSSKLGWFSLLSLIVIALVGAALWSRIGAESKAPEATPEVSPGPATPQPTAAPERAGKPAGPERAGVPSSDSLDSRKPTSLNATNEPGSLREGASPASAAAGSGASGAAAPDAASPSATSLGAGPSGSRRRARADRATSKRAQATEPDLTRPPKSDERTAKPRATAPKSRETENEVESEWK